VRDVADAATGTDTGTDTARVMHPRTAATIDRRPATV
jgi:hypothetical protein